jgi:hypothetical protein
LCGSGNRRQHGITGLFDADDQGGMGLGERSRGNAPQDLEPLLGGGGDDGGICLTGGHAEHGMGRDEIDRRNSEPLTAGIE